MVLIVICIFLFNMGMKSWVLVVTMCFSGGPLKGFFYDLIRFTISKGVVIDLEIFPFLFVNFLKLYSLDRIS